MVVLMTCGVKVHIHITLDASVLTLVSETMGREAIPSVPSPPHRLTASGKFRRFAPDRADAHVTRAGCRADCRFHPPAQHSERLQRGRYLPCEPRGRHFSSSKNGTPTTATEYSFYQTFALYYENVMRCAHKVSQMCVRTRIA